MGVNQTPVFRAPGTSGSVAYRQNAEITGVKITGIAYVPATNAIDVQFETDGVFEGTAVYETSLNIIKNNAVVASESRSFTQSRPGTVRTGSIPLNTSARGEVLIEVVINENEDISDVAIISINPPSGGTDNPNEPGGQPIEPPVEDPNESPLSRRQAAAGAAALGATLWALRD